VNSPARRTIPRVALLGLAALMLGCSQNNTLPTIVEITGDDFMKFNVTSFEAKPGQKVTVRLKNIGELPKEAMSHNWVLLGKEAQTPRFI